MVVAGVILCLVWFGISLLPLAPAPAPQIPPPAGMDLPGLVKVDHAAPLLEKHYVETIRKGEQWEIRRDGKLIATGDEAAARRALDPLFPRDEPEPFGPLVISAPGSAVLRSLAPIAGIGMRGAGRTVHLLVAGGDGPHTIIVRSTHPPFACGPIVHVAQDGRIHVGSGQSFQRMDLLSEGPPYPKFDEMLEIYSAAAEAANSQGILSLQAHQDCTLEDFLHLISHIASYGIRVNTDAGWKEPPVSSHANATPEKKPSSPSSENARVIEKAPSQEVQIRLAPER